MNLIDSLIAEKWLKTDRLIDAFKKVKRIDFLPQESKDLAELDEAMSIGYSQTISQPLVVAFMMELLEPQVGNKVLDIGSGSGYTSALLAEIVGRGGRVVAIEIIHELKEFGEKNAAKYNQGNMEFVCANGSKGYPAEAPYDRILASASLEQSLPAAWKQQLKVGGIIVTPINKSIWKFQKLSEERFEEKEYPGFVFVPFV